MSLSGTLWHHAAARLAPLLRPWLRLRARRGKEIAARLAERRGEGAARPPGRLLWLHAASVGETMSILPLLEALAARAPDLTLLVTTVTVTGAKLLAQRLPPELAPRVMHRFLPLDVPAWVARFLDAWRPDAVALVESELWPNLLAALRARQVPVALVNARLSARAARGWAWAPGLAREMLGGFRLVLAQSATDAARLRALGAPRVETPGNLKYAAPPLPAVPEALGALRAAIGGRPVFLAASTHPGEEAVVLGAHRALAPELPGLLTIIVPRHPERGAAIAAMAGGLPLSRRATGALPAPEEAVHIADTLGELGLFYRLAGVCLVGGSLIPHGGQNPLEPARLGCPILVGPHHWNFAEPVRALLEMGAARVVTEATLAAAVMGVLTDGVLGRRMADSAARIAAAGAGLPEHVADRLLALLARGRATPPARGWANGLAEGPARGMDGGGPARA
ncbi:3-deoxy-D-manno-octulosonic acid transferase [Siccirubricoccus sp. KC 17139]|uniref:3-deoxy-D-manno-octulosonic acid transferase n=1 Tax=Siccirubricoccus soli TaxID=2899147 RepID=A0ABT1DBL8_9PROT|nr:3-deoxy-D-manno-octulosonic acid transferase [Siccirubricoccus soli]MCO6419336.1 3-deoxy-D-manno-octulosonic acid transferase [Siccirubricoccus soli]MCP2685471.1 3-deoxy-D-manno-octulosonic acid transferase [Siccirubricoccus soli]